MLMSIPHTTVCKNTPKKEKYRIITENHFLHTFKTRQQQGAELMQHWFTYYILPIVCFLLLLDYFFFNY